MADIHSIALRARRFAFTTPLARNTTDCSLRWVQAITCFTGACQPTKQKPVAATEEQSAVQNGYMKLDLLWGHAVLSAVEWYGRIRTDGWMSLGSVTLNCTPVRRLPVWSL